MRSTGFPQEAHILLYYPTLPKLSKDAQMPRFRPVRVVHVVGQFEIGGMEKLLVEFARHADRERFDLHFLSLGKRGVVADEIEALGWPTTSLDTTPGLKPALVIRLALLFRKFRANVVHTHNTGPL